MYNVYTNNQIEVETNVKLNFHLTVCYFNSEV